MASQNRTKKFKKITLWTFSFFSKICIAWKNQGINATRLRISKKNLVDRGRRKMAKERHMTLRARSLCFPIILRVFDTTTCYVNTSTETRPIDLRRNGLLRGRVAAFRERERERTLSTWQPFSESSTREPTSVCLHCALDYLPRIPPIFSSFHLQFLPPFNDLSKQKNGKNLLKLLNPYLNSSNKR